VCGLRRRDGRGRPRARSQSHRAVPRPTAKWVGPLSGRWVALIGRDVRVGGEGGSHADLPGAGRELVATRCRLPGGGLVTAAPPSTAERRRVTQRPVRLHRHDRTAIEPNARGRRPGRAKGRLPENGLTARSVRYPGLQRGRTGRRSTDRSAWGETVVLPDGTTAIGPLGIDGPGSSRRRDARGACDTGDLYCSADPTA
jgi:hypothetical protein